MKLMGYIPNTGDSAVPAVGIEEEEGGGGRGPRSAESCEEKCEGKPKSKQCKRNCKNKPGRSQRATGGGSLGPATKKTPTAGKDCNKKCGQLRGAKKRRCQENKKQCKGNGKGKGKGKGKGNKNRTG